MCGIVGVCGNILALHEKMFEWLLKLDTDRGPHSTGVLSVTSEGKRNVVKCLGTPWQLFGDDKYVKLMRKKHKVLLGHNRWATTGAVTARNAHPFTHGHVSGVHNGTLRTQSLLDDHKHYEVDSDNIYYHLSKNSIEDTISKLHGAYCLVWVDAKTQELCMIRNHERPLFFATTEDGKTIFWASEAWMLNIAAGKAGVKIIAPIALPENTLVRLRPTITGYEEVEGSGKILRGHTPVYTTTTHHGRNNSTYYNGYNKPKEKVFFDVIGEVNSDYGSRPYVYTSGEIARGSKTGDLVRIFCSTNASIRTLMDGSMELFSGDITNTFEETIKSTGRKRTVHILECHSIKEEKFNSNVHTLPTGRKLVGKDMMTEKEFDKKVHLGCAWCNTIPKFEEAEKCVFNSDGSEFLCPDCNVVEKRCYFDIEDQQEMAI